MYEMSLVQANKGIRKELELLTREVRVISAIYWVLLQFVSEDQKHQIKSEVSKIISAQFSQEEIISYHRRNSDRINRTTLEFEVLEIIKPLRKLSEQKIVSRDQLEDFLNRGWKRLEELADNKVIIEIKKMSKLRECFNSYQRSMEALRD